MKRHQGLVPLSRDHHQGLLLATRLQQGKNALLTDWSHDRLWQAKFTSSFFQTHLVKHFQIEEEILFPTAEQYLKDTSIVSSLRDQHREMERFASMLRRPSTEEQLEELLIQFGKILEDHIRSEERKLFQMCEEEIPPHELEKLGIRIAQAQKTPS